jgi:hypothetical protein
LSPVAVDPASVALAAWRLTYGDEDAAARRFDALGRQAAVRFVVGLVQHVEEALLEASVDDPWLLADRIAPDSVPTHLTDRERLCEQLGITLPSRVLCGEWLSSVARDIAATVAGQLMPILQACQPSAGNPAGRVSRPENPPPPLARVMIESTLHAPQGDADPAGASADRLVGDGDAPKRPRRNPRDRVLHLAVVGVIELFVSMTRGRRRSST